MKQFLVLPKTSLYISVLMFSVLLGACGLDSSSDSSSQSSNDVSSDTLVTASFSGSVGDGPVVAATLNIYDRDGSLVRTVISDNTANYSAKVKTKGKAYPLTIEVDGGTDLVTQLAPDFRMTSFISHPSEKNININPFTTMIVEAARTMPGGLNDENVAAAGTIVEEKLNFGLNPGVVADAITTKVDDVNIAVFTKSSETMGEMIRRTRDHLMAIGVVGSGDDVVAALAHDIADGELDGLGGSKASIRVAAVSKLISAQVVIEALSNNLKVGDMVATDRMDDAIVATHPLLPRSSTTDSVPLNQELLAQGRDNIKVAQILLPSEEVDAIAAILDTLRAGSLASEVEAVLPADTSKVLDQPVSVAVAATDQQLDVALNGDGTGFPTSPPTDPPLANRAPVLSGTPATTVLEDTAYLYQPSATDADGDTLNFSIQNRPDWASFDTTTGRLSGTPANPHVGTYGNIVVTVSDGNLVDSIGPFSITVTNTNDTPSISGSAATSATAGGFYSFQPSASDPDGDDLTFSITKRPSWASFNINSGRLSGTPANGDAGIYDGIVISVSDGSVSRSLPTFAITVNANLPSNQSPVIRGTPATSVAEDSAYVFQPTASDADGDSLTYSISNRPAWASFNSTTGRLSGTPKNSHVGPYKNILITVSDGAASASIGPFSITVSNTNDAPVISGTPARSVDEGSAYRFQPTASDADGDSLTYSISNRPGWASFNSTSGRLSGTPKNADVGSYSNIKITVSDGTASASVGPFTITVSNTNDAPVISGTPASSVAEDSAYVFQPSASDADGDSLAYSISNRPSWASFNNATGRLTGTPKNGDVGSYSNIRITVSDGTASASVGPFTITVSNTNDAPVISGTPASSVAEDSAYVFQPSASDADGDSLTYSISNRPSWASFNNATGRLTGTPKNGDVGSYSNIRITVSDGTASASVGPFTITVTNINDTPVISGTPASSVAEGSAYVFQPSASDADGDSLTYSISNRPSWASFNNTNGRLSGTPKNGDVGSYNNIAITVSDGTASASVGPFTITVTNINDTPVISGTPASSVAEDSAYVFQPSASDADGDSLTYSISNRPAWASFNSTSGRLSGTPKNGDVGSYNNIAITVSDGTASDSLGPFSITVNNTNDAPVIGGTPLTSVDEGSAYEFMPTASDPDGDNLTFSIQNRPPWASFNTATGGLSGTPGSGDAATYNNIRISVSDGATSVNLAPFSVTVNGAAPQTGSATVSWVAPVARADGNPLALSEIAGYILYYGESEGDYPNSLQIDDATSTSLTITDLPFGTYYCVMTTKDTEGNESVFSEMVTKVVN